MKKHTSTKWLSTAALGLLVLTPISQALAETKINSLEPITVTANRIELLDTEAPYATEIYSWEEIQKSGATTLYDFLGRNTSMNVMPSYGNPFSQLLDMRGFGIGDGYQNIVVTVDGRRMNNIDGVPQLLSSIPLHNIERIEIIKGSGSVAQGDGATAGTLNIITRKKDGGSFLVSKGSHGHTQGNINLGVVGEKYALSLGAEIYGLDGYREEDPMGQKDTATANNLQAGLQLFPTDEVELRLGAAHSKLDVAYGSPLTKSEFKDNPKQYKKRLDGDGNILDNNYTQQRYETNTLPGFNSQVQLIKLGLDGKLL
ncbi:TonB-dependent receptor plug domain-containing protein [Marinospirillum insulare]|uniref:TonB-dependent receptor plug domain-containing protein n=1 Tax=Marinospirillum insulare TaxID=217169 RepID=A0ABQ6A109_9GAMM|nr:TonB-dependent receptor plug domain-containing protein [Marinospirillum insulare]GLR65068.1 hypothetical protein GCM10007878_25070 [Marinospirillum insulare]